LIITKVGFPPQNFDVRSKLGLVMRWIDLETVAIAPRSFLLGLPPGEEERGMTSAFTTGIW
jgi:hypothetical protein